MDELSVPHAEPPPTTKRKRAPRRPMSDLAGQRFTRLVAERAELNKGKKRWRCVCDCGKVVYVDAPKLVDGRTRSCGCLKAEHIGAYRLRPLNDAERERVRKLYRQGWSHNRIVQELKLPLDQVKKATRGQAYNNDIARHWNRIVALRSNGLTFKEIHRKLRLKSPVETFYDRFALIEKRRLLVEQLRLERRVYRPELIMRLTNNGFSARAISDIVGTSSRNVVRYRGGDNKLTRSARQKLYLSYDFDQVKRWFMDEGLSWRKIKNLLKAKESVGTIERWFHAEADRRAGVVLG